VPKNRFDHFTNENKEVAIKMKFFYPEFNTYGGNKSSDKIAKDHSFLLCVSIVHARESPSTFPPQKYYRVVTKLFVFDQRRAPGKVLIICVPSWLNNQT
jgi:hypothetical protein